MSSRELARALRDALKVDGNLPVPLQALIAGTLICSRGGTPSRIGMSKVGGYSYGSSQKHYAELLNVIVDKLPVVVGGMTAVDIDPATTARLREELHKRDETIAHLRQELKTGAERRDQVRRYALAMHNRVRAMEEQKAAENGTDVSTLHPLP